MNENRTINRSVMTGKGDFQIRKTIIRAKALREEDDREERRRAIINPYIKQHKTSHNNSIFRQEKQLIRPPSPPLIQHMNEQFIKSSKLYRMMEEQIASVITRHAEEMESLNETLDNQCKQQQAFMKDCHSLKIKVWELKNQITQLQGNLAHEENEYTYLSGLGRGEELVIDRSQQQSQQHYRWQSQEQQRELLDSCPAEEEKQIQEDNEAMRSDQFEQSRNNFSLSEHQHSDDER